MKMRKFTMKKKRKRLKLLRKCHRKEEKELLRMMNLQML